MNTKTTLWNLVAVPGWKLSCLLEQAYYERSEVAISLIKAEIERRECEAKNG